MIHVHSDLADYCKDGVVLLVKKILSEESKIDINYGDGIYFYFALDLPDESECLEVLEALLSYAEEAGVNKRKLAETINDAMERVRGTIYDSALELIKPYLEVLEEGSSVHYESCTTVENTSNIEESAQAAKTGDIEALSRHFDRNSDLYKLRIISLAIQDHQDSVINAIAGMMDTVNQKASIFRIAGDFYALNSLEKSVEYYSKSLELHPGCFVTISKLGALYEEFFCKTGDDMFRQKAIEYYNLAIPMSSEHKVDDVAHKLAIVETHLKILQNSSAYEFATAEIDSLDDLLSFSSESYDSSEIIGDVYADTL